MINHTHGQSLERITTMKLIKARVKRINDIDPVRVCCTQAKDYILYLNKKSEVFTIDLDITELSKVECQHCGLKTNTEEILVRVINSSEGSGYTCLVDLDLSESSYSL